ncbi:4Fe-4S ferredoxin iron-sulfur binding domain protein [Spironucleus salmonicida]|uniref:4Fe-4S ferredoxin iron-sulfur binding domain protein n=1 Tax=Spironucleus salmonicida TaxID=348837 RepID=V6LS53_9EUKA|nr:4Fe-4S ferredoxin iron-sulfur binding domain protein [Spironucleus salmonicida]|eukprot:EST47405.1 4Fe-4S ferredoxin iron-sulfur binding domain protein [Spironucleus salmonicida]
MPHKIKASVCQGCQNCLTQCPADAISLVNESCFIDPDGCVDCGNCKAVCQNNAVLEAGEDE